ncbi:MAG: bifunctional DNA-formamidopyrimidine glycosylase/DNA-(apurinic or apyrimidinic site) lyase [Bryobacterales bacterium]|nr:bifunctional DNA-formamidopyrimidine glycosylase/DNA-(apurinic or apyrimidinic site) lyase [Bryobacterales bacterium]
MPELPEVEAVCRKLRVQARGARIVRMRVERPGIVQPQSKTKIEREVADCVLEDVERRGKNILLRLSGGRVLRVHLRMTGNLYVIPNVRFRPSGTRVWWEMEGGRGLVFEDSRALGKVHLYSAGELEQALENVGVEPLSEEFTEAWFVTAARRSRKPAKLFLMDQQYVAGLGNIYAAEALFRARVHPERPVCGVSKPKLAALHSAIRSVLEEALASAELAYAEPGRFVEGESFARAVYGREAEPCVRCGGRIRRIAQGGRSTYFCAGCQR